MKTRDALRLCAQKLDYLSWCVDDHLNGGLHKAEDFKEDLEALKNFLMDIGWEMSPKIETKAEPSKEILS